MATIIANNGLVLGIMGYKSQDLPIDESYTIMSEWGLEGTHMTGQYRINPVPTPFDAIVDLETMIVTSISD